MASLTPDRPTSISPRELVDVIARAHDEQWRELALLGPHRGHQERDSLIAQQWPTERIYVLDHSLGQGDATKLASLTSLTSLNLGNNSIGDEGARALASLTSLTSLNLTGNSIGAEGARALASLTSLTSLHLTGNSIGAEGARALASLTSLTSLNLRGNSIGDEGARALASLTSLTSLNLRGNSIGDEGARALASLTSLTSLHLRGNSIGDEGARALASLTSLTSLNLRGNSIGDEGARALASLTSLTSLNLTGNSIGDEGARALASLTSLTSLYLGNNSIGDEGARALLDAWVDAPHSDRLRTLDLRHNDDLSKLLPDEVLENTDAQAILAAYRRYRAAEQKQTLTPLNEAKLLVVGNEAVGKTSLIRYLVKGEPRDPDEGKTPRVAIHEQIDTQPWSVDSSSVILNVWDFGGQEIMHGTHRFFLTERSLYLLVLEARREDDRSVYDWLKTIRNRGGDSPVIVVINKCDDDKHKLRLDESGLQKEYPNIVKFVRTSCDPGVQPAETIARLRHLIAETLASDERLKHIRDPIPQAWLRVKEAVADLARKDRVLEMKGFTRLCERPKESTSAAGSSRSATSNQDVIDDENEQRALLRLLHDLGVVIAHGLTRDAPAAMREITLLDPNWLTGAIYTLLNSRKVADQSGEFARSQLDELLDPKLYPPKWHEFILDMMEAPEVGLCFELPGSQHQRYLIPEALPANEPDYDVWPANSLRFRFDYDFLPPGLIPRFIVQAHRNLTDLPTRWRTGVVLNAADCHILVRGDRDRRRVDIFVAGPATRKRSALNIVLNDLEYVHADNPEIGAKALVPLIDQPELDVSYDHLLKLEMRQGLDYPFYPEDANREYTVRELLEGVRRAPRVEDERSRIIHVHGDYNEGGKQDMSENYNTNIGDGNQGINLNIGKGINQVTAEKIENSFNRAQSAENTSDNIKTLLQQLANEVAQIAANQPPDQAEETADALETLAKEVTRPTPRRKWWELSVEGIKEAASAVGEVGKTTLGLLAQLVPLLDS